MNLINKGKTMTTFNIIILIIFAIFFILGVIAISLRVRENMQFKHGRNPFSRICKDCGAHQDQYRSNIEGCEHQTWWVEVYPIGNNPECKCHSYAEDREW